MNTIGCDVQMLHDVVTAERRICEDGCSGQRPGARETEVRTMLNSAAIFRQRYMNHIMDRGHHRNSRNERRTPVRNKGDVRTHTPRSTRKVTLFEEHLRSVTAPSRLDELKLHAWRDCGDRLSDVLRILTSAGILRECGLEKPSVKRNFHEMIFFGDYARFRDHPSIG